MQIHQLPVDIANNSPKGMREGQYNWKYQDYQTHLKYVNLLLSYI